MRIDKLDVYYVVMPLIYPWRTAYGEDRDIHSVLVKATSGEWEAWSESTPFFAPTYLTESAGSVFYHVSEVFGPYVVGREYETAADLNARLDVFKGNSFAKAAIEIGWWALASRISGTPLHRLLGGRTREVVAGADFGIQDSFDMLLGNIQQAVDAGFPRIKLKVAKGWDLDMLQVVRKAFPDFTFHIDCNSGYTLEDLPFFKAIDGLGLAFIEQPLHFADVLDHAELARQIETPICLDETIVSVRAAEQAIRTKACRYINIKPGRIGGLSNALAVHDLARDAGAAVVGTGRSDFSNQINNSLAFPGVFRGALDVRASRITNRMKVAAAEALAGLIQEPTAERVIPWTLDPAVVPAVAPAVGLAWLDGP